MIPSPSFYLGPRKPRLRAESWDDMVGAAAAGVADRFLPYTDPAEIAQRNR
jgi:hypothetical protein